MNNDRQPSREGRRARPKTVLLAALALLMLTGCGQKGPLFLPDDAEAGQESAEKQESDREKDDSDSALRSD